MNTTINLGDLGLLILGFALLILIVYLALFFKNLSETIGQIKKLLSTNESNLNLILSEAPKIASNVESITNNVASDVEMAQQGIDDIIGMTHSISNAIAETKSISNALTSSIQLLIFVRNTLKKFSKDKE